MKMLRHCKRPMQVKDYESSSLNILKRTKIIVSNLQKQYKHHFSNHKFYSVTYL